MDIYNEMARIDKEMSALITDAAGFDIHLANELEFEKQIKLKNLEQILVNAGQTGVIYVPADKLALLLARVTHADFEDRAEELTKHYKDMRHLQRCHQKELSK